jgi:predicted small lipoprotein YifL
MSLKLLAPFAALLVLTLAACGDAPDTEAPPADAAPATEPADPATEPAEPSN